MKAAYYDSYLCFPVITARKEEVSRRRRKSNEPTLERGLEMDGWVKTTVDVPYESGDNGELFLSSCL